MRLGLFSIGGTHCDLPEFFCCIIEISWTPRKKIVSLKIHTTYIPSNQKFHEIYPALFPFHGSFKAVVNCAMEKLLQCIVLMHETHDIVSEIFIQ